MEEKDQYETKIISTEEALERFMESTVWKDMQKELQTWGIMALREFDYADSMEKVKELQGIRQALDRVLDLPQHLLEAVREANKEKAKSE